MAQYEHLPIYKQTYDILLRTMVATKDFPREYKFTLGQKIKDELIELVTPESLEPYYHMPNVARRLLENFLAFKMPNVSGELHRKVEDSTLDATKKTSIVRFLHKRAGFELLFKPDSYASACSASSTVIISVMGFSGDCEKPYCR